MPISSEHKRVPHPQKRDHLQWQHTARFVEEVERLEGEGRVKSRLDLEHRLLLPYGRITAMRAGRFRVPTSAIELLKREFNGDFQFVLLGVRDVELASWWRGGKDLRLHQGYAYHYQGPAADLRTLGGLPPLPKDQA